MSRKDFIAIAETQIPQGFSRVSQDEFFAALQADPRDIMPRLVYPDFTTWQVVSNQAQWGWSSPGWANPNPYGEKVYAVRRSSL